MFADFENMPYGTALRVITESIAAFHQVDAVILFGSRARGNNRLPQKLRLCAGIFVRSGSKKAQFT